VYCALVEQVKGHLILLCLKEDSMEQTSVLPLQAPGRHFVGAVDNIIFAIHFATQTALLFDISARSEPLLLALPVGMTSAAKNAVSAASSAISSNPDVWVYHGSNYLICTDAQVQSGCFFSLQLMLQHLANSWSAAHLVRLVDLLLKRSYVDAKLLLLRVLSSIVLRGSIQGITLLSRLFSILARLQSEIPVELADSLMRHIPISAAPNHRTPLPPHPHPDFDSGLTDSRLTGSISSLNPDGPNELGSFVDNDLDDKLKDKGKQVPIQTHPAVLAQGTQARFGSRSSYSIPLPQSSSPVMGARRTISGGSPQAQETSHLSLNDTTGNSHIPSQLGSTTTSGMKEGMEIDDTAPIQDMNSRIQRAKDEILAGIPPNQRKTPTPLSAEVQSATIAAATAVKSISQRSRGSSNSLNTHTSNPHRLSADLSSPNNTNLNTSQSPCTPQKQPVSPSSNSPSSPTVEDDSVDIERDQVETFDESDSFPPTNSNLSDPSSPQGGISMSGLNLSLNVNSAPIIASPTLHSARHSLASSTQNDELGGDGDILVPIPASKSSIGVIHEDSHAEEEVEGRGKKIIPTENLVVEIPGNLSDDSDEFDNQLVVLRNFFEAWGLPFGSVLQSIISPSSFQVVTQSDMFYHVFLPLWAGHEAESEHNYFLLSNARSDHQEKESSTSHPNEWMQMSAFNLVTPLAEYIRAICRYKLRVDPCLNHLLFTLLVESGRFSDLHQYLQYHIVTDSLAIAEGLLALSQVYSPFYQTAIDMLYRLHASSRVLQVLLQQGAVTAALRLVSYKSSIFLEQGVSPREFFVTAMEHRNRAAFFTAWLFFQKRNAFLAATGQTVDNYLDVLEHSKEIFLEIDTSILSGTRAPHNVIH